MARIVNEHESFDIGRFIYLPSRGVYGFSITVTKVVSEIFEKLTSIAESKK